MKNEERVGLAVTTLARIAPPVFRKLYTPNCCVVATKIAIDTLAAVGVRARPINTRYTALNRKYIALVEKHGRYPESVDELHEWTDKLGAWSLSTDVGNHDGGFGGHLIALVAEHVMLDLSASQAARPAKGIHIPGPVIGAVPRPWPVGAIAPVELDQGGFLMYERVADDPVYRDAPDWKDPLRRDNVTAAFVEAIREVFRGVDSLQKTE